MSLQQRLMADLHEAVRAKDEVRRGILRLVIAGIKNAEIAQGSPLDDGAVLGVIAKEVKRHQESIAEFRKGDRPDLVAKEEAELALLLDYLPQQMSREEIGAAARQVIAEIGAASLKDKGQIMGRLVAQLKGRADGREINVVVTELLAALSPKEA
ncbi:MAG: GatB/YqeY domain-containing protein [Chloroflexi bacterium]|nr:GatB/YqeY domain-containing protein [Chloroflexota bacterium]